MLVLTYKCTCEQKCDSANNEFQFISSYGLLKEVVALCDLHQWRDYTEARQATAPGVKLRVDGKNT